MSSGKYEAFMLPQLPHYGYWTICLRALA